MLSPLPAPYAEPRNSDCVSADLPRNRLAANHDATPASITPTAANTATGAVTVYVPTATVYVPRDDTVSATAVPAPATTLPTPPALAPALAPAAPVSDMVSATAAPVSNPPIARARTRFDEVRRSARRRLAPPPRVDRSTTPPGEMDGWMVFVGSIRLESLFH